MKGAADPGVPVGVWALVDEAVDIFKETSMLALTSSKGPLALVGVVGCMIKFIFASALKLLGVMGEGVGSEVRVDSSKA